MRIGYVSTYPPTRCGIATYTRLLARAVGRKGKTRPVVLAERGARDERGPVQVIPAFDRREPFARPVVEAAARARLDVVHIQHAPDILGMGRELLGLVEGLDAAGIRSVITPHTVYDTWSGLIERKPHSVWFHRALARRVDAIVVHQPSMLATLAGHGVAAPMIHEIPHGTERVRGDGRRARKQHHIPREAPLLLFFGFVHVQKNVHTLLQAMPRVLSEVPDARLLVAGEIAGNTWYNLAYSRYLDGLIRALRLERRVTLTRRFVKLDRVADLYTAADLVLLPHHQGYGSASGVLHQALGAERPLLCSDVPKFEEVRHQVDPKLMLSPTDPDAWAEAIVALLRDPGRRADLASRFGDYARDTSWGRIARRHLALYRGLVG